MAIGPDRELKSVGYEVFILLLTLLSALNTIFVLLGILLGRAGGPAQDVILVMDTVITPIFLVDFAYRLTTARSRRGYFVRGQGWADLLAVIPMFRFLRAFRVIRVVRLLRAQGGRRLVSDLVEARASATFLLTIFLVLFVLEAAGASIYYVEGSAETANIRSAGDALWWGIVTITTVGYGDQFPVTPGGRVIGVFLLLAGIGLFSVLTGFIANVFLAPPQKPRLAPPPTSEPRGAILAVRTLLAEQEERTAAIRRRLDELERAIGATAPTP
jgi:voltage-gated potassium channel